MGIPLLEALIRFFEWEVFFFGAAQRIGSNHVGISNVLRVTLSPAKEGLLKNTLPNERVPNRDVCTLAMLLLKTLLLARRRKLISFIVKGSGKNKQASPSPLKKKEVAHLFAAPPSLLSPLRLLGESMWVKSHARTLATYNFFSWLFYVFSLLFWNGEHFTQVKRKIAHTALELDR